MRRRFSPSIFLLFQLVPRLGPPLGILVLVQPVGSVDEGLEPLEALLVDGVHRHGVVLHLELKSMS